MKEETDEEKNDDDDDDDEEEESGGGRRKRRGKGRWMMRRTMKLRRPIDEPITCITVM